jgi:hypothetical protein
MGFESLLLIVVVVEAVWILSSLFRGSDDNRKGIQRRALPRDGEPATARQRPESNVDRFLEEINRRRREAAERQAGTARPDTPPVSRPVPAPASLEAPQRRRPGSAPVIVATRPAPAVVVARQPQAEAFREKPRSQEVPLEVELDKPASPPTLAAPPLPVPARGPSAVTSLPPVKRVTSSTQTHSRREAPLLNQLLPLLRDRKNLPAALALNEILGPPLSRRSRRPRRKAV